ncbi:MAG: hypothetical protein ACREIS_04345 [Nitrospiraceae bacterium]
MGNGEIETRSSLITHHGSRITDHGSFPALDALLLFFILNLVLQPLVDPDFGWHLRTGLDLIQHGWRLPATDPYSHTVPDWPWVEHAWLTDGVIGLIYRSLGTAGPLGVMVLFALVAAAAFVLAVGHARAGRTAILAAVAATLWVALPFLGARTQMVSLLGLALILRLCAQYQAGRRTNLWVIPLVFLLWANLHGAFTAGLFAMGLVLVASGATRLVVDQWPVLADRLHEPVMGWSQMRRLALVGGLAALLTLVNLYGWRLYQELYLSLTDQFMIQTLHEWQPVSLETRAGTLYLAYLAALGILMVAAYRRVEPVRWVMLAVFLGLSLKHWRNVPLFLLVSVPLVAELVAHLTTRASARFVVGLQRQKRVLLAVTVAAAVGVVVLGPAHLEQVVQCGVAPEEFFRSTEYPIEAVQWLRAHRGQVGSRLYNDYGVGGFLLWWLPEEKIFIDGRMPAFRMGDRWIFKDYVALTSWDPPALGVLNKYAVDWAIVGRGTPLQQALGSRPDWGTVYEDAKVTIYVRSEE